jgi:hypothetical protein
MDASERKVLSSLAELILSGNITIREFFRKG